MDIIPWYFFSAGHMAVFTRNIARFRDRRRCRNVVTLGSTSSSSSDKFVGTRLRRDTVTSQLSRSSRTPKYKHATKSAKFLLTNNATERYSSVKPLECSIRFE